MDRPDLVIDQEIQKLNETLALCKRVAETLETKGWTEIIEPLIEKSILDITGGKLNGRWYGGLMDRARKDERREFYVGYKQALIDLHRRIFSYVDAIELNENKVSDLIKSKTPKYRLPMVDDTRYGRTV